MPKGQSIPGHSKQLVVGPMEGLEGLVVAQAGREHLYEDVNPARAVFWLRVMQLLGVETLLASNAAGIVTANTLSVGDIMTVMGDRGADRDVALKGPNDENFGPRFPHKAYNYPRDVRRLIQTTARDLGLKAVDGIYTRFPGPGYELPSDVCEMRVLLRRIWEEGALDPATSEDYKGLPVGTVGMSSNYEMAVAAHASLSNKFPAFRQAQGLISVPTNYSASMGPQGFLEPSNHEEVAEAAGAIQEQMGELGRRVIVQFEKARKTK